MAPDNVPAFAGAGSVVTEAFDDVAGVYYRLVKLAFGALDTATIVSTANGLPVNIVAGGAGDGAILDGVTSSIKATVLDYASSNPLAVRLTDTAGDYIAAGAGTQYTEDAAAAADPIGNALIMVRDDALSAQTTTDGDNVAARGTNKGELYVKHADTLTVDGSGVTQPVSNAGLTELAAAINGSSQMDINIAASAVDVMLGTDFSAVFGSALQTYDFDTGAGTDTVVAFGLVAPASGGAVAIPGSATAGLKVDLGADNDVTNAGTFATQVDGAALTALQLIDDTIYADEATFTPATSKVGAVGYFADETSPDSAAEGSVGIARMTLDRMQRAVAEQSDTVRAGATSRTVINTPIAATTSGNNTLVTNSNGGLKIRVFALTIVAAAAVSLYFTADAAGTVIFGGSTNKISLAANSGLVLPYNPAGWFDTTANTDVVMNLSGTVIVSGGICYAEV